MDKVVIEDYSPVYVRLHCDYGIAREISEHFSFFAENYKFNPRFKIGVWDGKIKLFNRQTKLIYKGLVPHIIDFCKSREYEFILDGDFSVVDWSDEDTVNLFKSCKIDESKSPRDYQLGTITRCIKKNRALVVSPTACHRRGDHVYSTKGWLKVEDVQVGDFLYGPDGSPKEVLSLYRGKDEIFEIRPRQKGDSIFVTGNHTLQLRFTDHKAKYSYAKNDPYRTELITVKDFLDKSKSYKHVAVLRYNDVPIEQSHTIDTIFDPYFVGLYLGDGHTHSIEVTTKDQEIVEYLTEYVKNFDCYLKYKGELTYSINMNKKGRNHPIRVEFQKFGLHFLNNDSRTRCQEKFIHNDFLVKTSVDFRLQLLAGLIDSDGYLQQGKRSYEFSSKSQALAEGVKQLALSLGLRAILRKSFNQKHQTTYYTTYIFGNVHLIPCKLTRKQALTPKSDRNSYNACFDCIQTNQVEDYYGFEVRDHLYITNSGMVTHNSGKSLLIYLLVRYYNKPTLILVPSIQLVHQMYDDFREYGYDVENNVHCIFGGKDKFNFDKKITLSTWQSIYKMDKSYFDKFEVVIGDEAHKCKAKSLTDILQACTSAPYRFGFTGSLDDSITNRMVLEGLFGQHFKLVSTAQLQQQGFLADLNITSIKLKYSEETRKACKKMDYHEEVKFLVTHERRNKVISDLATRLKGNTLVLYQYVENHGIPLHEMISKKASCQTFLIHGGVKPDYREEVRKTVNESTNSILVASMGCFAEGINIPNINNLIIASPTKSKIRVTQMIGRGLRKSDRKSKCSLYDIGDDLSHKSHKNYSLQHYVERIKLYVSEGFTWNERIVQIKE